MTGIRNVRGRSSPFVASHCPSALLPRRLLRGLGWDGPTAPAGKTAAECLGETDPWTSLRRVYSVPEQFLSSLLTLSPQVEFLVSGPNGGVSSVWFKRRELGYIQAIA